jgi:hypothetical protein
MKNADHDTPDLKRCDGSKHNDRDRFETEPFAKLIVLITAIAGNVARPKTKALKSSPSSIPAMHQ